MQLTSCDKQPRDGAEMASATRVSVTLANDEKRDLLQAESGAILSTSAETQPILPMAELVSAGCEISWEKGNFKVVHPVWGELRTTIRGGCPELAQEQAARYGLVHWRKESIHVQNLMTSMV